MQSDIVPPAIKAKPKVACKLRAIASPVQQQVPQSSAAMIRSDDELVEIRGRLGKFIRSPEIGVTTVERQARYNLTIWALDNESASGADPSLYYARTIGTRRPLLDSGFLQPGLGVPPQAEHGLYIVL